MLCGMMMMMGRLSFFVIQSQIRIHPTRIMRITEMKAGGVGLNMQHAHTHKRPEPRF